MILKLATAAALCLGLAVCTSERPPVEQLQRDLGFACDSPRIRSGDQVVEIPAITVTDRQGLMATAGVRSGHLLSGFSRCEDFYKELERVRGRTYSLTLIPGGDGLAVSERSRLVVGIAVPEPKTKQP